MSSSCPHLLALAISSPPLGLLSSLLDPRRALLYTYLAEKRSWRQLCADQADRQDVCERETRMKANLEMRQGGTDGSLALVPSGKRWRRRNAKVSNIHDDQIDPGKKKIDPSIHGAPAWAAQGEGGPRGEPGHLRPPQPQASTPTFVIRLGQHKVKSSIKYKSTNPEWNEELTLSVTNWTLPVKIEVFDHDTFTKDDSMGDAEFYILDFVEIARKDLTDVPDDTVMKTIHPDKDNCFSTKRSKSHITWKEGKVSQNIVLKLRNTDTGEIILHLEWVNIPGMAR
ncbi:ADP-ribosylation factor GTPase-activating protein AGD12 [Hordeum vulgare]|nr:ADP-ribosylation factor GTPase-activating protein AGD12 [Hordeum vulgare]